MKSKTIAPARDGFSLSLARAAEQRRAADCHVGVDSELGDDVSFVSECQRSHVR